MSATYEKCRACPEPAKPGRFHCQACLTRRAAEIRKYQDAKRAHGLCVVPRCENEPEIPGTTKCAAHRQKWREYSRKRLYGVTPEQFAEMMAAQNNVCAICRKSTDRFHVDHDHRANAIRGLLCFSCNSLIGRWNDSVGMFEAAIRYLRGEEVWPTT